MQYDAHTLAKLKEVELGILKQFHSFCVSHDLEYFLVFGSAIGAVRHKGFIPWDDDIDVGMMREDYERFVALFDELGMEGLELKTSGRDENYMTSVSHLQRKNTTFVSEFGRNMKCHQGICIDVFPYDKVSRDPEIRNKQLKGSYIYRRLLFLLGSGDPVIPATGVKKAILSAGCKTIHFGLKLSGMKASRLYDKFQYYCTLARDEDAELVCQFGESPSDIYIENLDSFYPIVETDFEDTKVMISKNVDAHLKTYYGDDYMEIPPEEKRRNHMPYLIDFEK